MTQDLWIITFLGRDYPTNVYTSHAFTTLQLAEETKKLLESEDNWDQIEIHPVMVVSPERVEQIKQGNYNFDYTVSAGTRTT